MIELPNPNSIKRVADWIELRVATTRELISKAEVSGMIEGSVGHEPSESFLSDVWHELTYRQQLYSQSFFEAQERIVEPKFSADPPIEYLACLLLSLFGAESDTQLPPKLFERIACQAVKQYLSGRAVVFGWPFDPDYDPSDESQIARKIKKVADDLQERFCEAPPSKFKDRGVDVIGWIPFKERRSGQVVLLLQCAAGFNWEKKKAVPIRNWYQYLHWALDPIIGFAVPSIVDDRDWHEKSREVGVLLDRARIVNLLSKGRKDKKLMEELDSWVQTQLSALST